MSADELFRLIFIGILVGFLPFALYHRVRSNHEWREAGSMAGRCVHLVRSTAGRLALVYRRHRLDDRSQAHGVGVRADPVLEDEDLASRYFAICPPLEMFCLCTPSSGPLLRKALPKCEQELQRSLETHFAPNDRPDDVLFLPQETDPRLGVVGDMQIRLSNVTFLDCDLLVGNHNGRFTLLVSGECEMVGGVQPRRFSGLEDMRHSSQKTGDAVGTQAVPNVLGLFVGKPFGNGSSRYHWIAT